MLKTVIIFCMLVQKALSVSRVFGSTGKEDAQRSISEQQDLIQRYAIVFSVLGTGVLLYFAYLLVWGMDSRNDAKLIPIIPAPVEVTILVNNENSFNDESEEKRGAEDELGNDGVEGLEIEMAHAHHQKKPGKKIVLSYAHTGSGVAVKRPLVRSSENDQMDPHYLGEVDQAVADHQREPIPKRKGNRKMKIKISGGKCQSFVLHLTLVSHL